MGKHLFIAEKPSVAKEFAKVLGVNGNAGNGYLESKDYVVTWCVGHLVTMSYPDAYDPALKKWSLQTIPFLPEQFLYELIPDVKKQFDIVAGLLNREDVTCIYVCTDSGREGEYIYRLVDQMAHVPASKDTYNMISVDGDTSTNDSVVLLANGMAENEVITVDSESYKTFAEALHEINECLAKKIAGDGEGATALFEVTVVGADTKETAKTLAKSIVCSNLTKTAIAGHDANWGRILCAMGYSGAQFDPEKVDLFFESKAGKIQIIENGTAVDYSEEKATEILSQEEVKAVADVKMGSESATAWGCDLTHGYIDINADYRS